MKWGAPASQAKRKNPPKTKRIRLPQNIIPLYGVNMTRSVPIPPDAVLRIKTLAPQARLARRQHRDNDPKVEASKELTVLFCKLRGEGCTISEIAKAADMTYHSVSARVKRGEKENA